MDTKQKLIGIIDSMESEIVACVQNFVKYPSLSGDEKNAQNYIAALLKDMQMEVDMWDPKIEDTKINPYYVGVRDSFENSPNVVGVLKGSGGGKSIILNGHVDVVPPGEADWDLSPFSGHVADGKVFGRGSVDMKGGVIASIMAVKALQTLGEELKGDIILQSVIEEETGGAGVLSAIKRGYKADAAIVTEPTDLKICPATIGAMWFRVTVKGRLAHAATSHLGVNAILKAAELMKAVQELEAERNGENRHVFYKDRPNPFSINIGTIKGGNFPTNVPNEAVFEGRMGIAPGEDVLCAREAFEKAIFAAAKNDPWLKDNKPIVEWYGFCFNSHEIEHDHPIVKTLQKSYSKVTNKEAVVGGTPWGTDAAALYRFGNIPAVVFGPGPGAMAHQANEYVSIEQLLNTTKIIALCLLEWAC